MSARERLEFMIRTEPSDMRIRSVEEARAAIAAYRVQVLVEAALWFERRCPEAGGTLPLCMCHAAPELRRYSEGGPR
ncbi:hypothetical protein DF268_08765 [Streptomyces sp. V2]|uniref:hypothetical protein n=1 Tax=Streptomyces sp. V2 TaxID=1424099 RepID=UPI000D66B57C|nr:hypothetical protein [Streptomyces sp. V2]PWG13946.1 hypothetical protein DF268_08765 [Streptomyces sp. V2]